MSPHPVEWVDVFTDRPGGGNPAAVCLLERPAPTAAMQAIAFEFGISETAFAWPLPDGVYSLRWFTPGAEVDLCGHATIATAHVMRRAGWVADAVTFETRSGRLGAVFAGDVVEIDLPADEARPAEVPSCLASLPVEAAVAGRTDLMVELPDPDLVRAATPDLEALAGLSYRGVILTAPGPGAGPGAGPGGVGVGGPRAPGDGPDYVLRFFAPGVGVPEDPATGSAQCLLGPWWAGRLGRSRLEAHQLSRRGAHLMVSVRGDRVGVAGPAVTVFEGRLAGGLDDGLDGEP